MAIITTIDQFTKYVEANALLDIETVNPSIVAAERAYLKPALSTAQYDALITKLENGGLDDKETGLLELCREVVANIAMAIAISRLAVQFSEGGIRRPEQAAYQYQEVNLRNSLAMSGFNALEDMLEYLEANKATFPEWAGSSSYLTLKEYFIQSAIEFNQFYDCKRSRLTYLRVRPIMRSIENFNVKDITGPGLFTALKNGLKAGNLSDTYKQLLNDYIKPGIALMTMGKAVIQRLVDVTDEGVSVSRMADYNNMEARDHASLADAEQASAALISEAEEYFRRLAEELAANPSTYPDYAAPVKKPALFNIQNKRENGIYGA